MLRKSLQPDFANMSESKIMLALDMATADIKFNRILQDKITSLADVQDIVKICINTVKRLKKTI